MTMQLEKDSGSHPVRQQPTRVRLPSDPHEARRLQEEIEGLLKALQYGEHDLFAVRLALEEGLINAIKHGNQGDRSKVVDVCYLVTAERFEVSIADQGPGFNPADVPDPTAEENLERPCGRGLMLMRHYMTEVAYNAAGNAVRMHLLRKTRK